MYSSIEDFLQELEIIKNELLPNSNIEIIYKRIDKTSPRLRIRNDVFIDIYANAETGRYDFSLIKDNQRVFGYRSSTKTSREKLIFQPSLKTLIVRKAFSLISKMAIQK